MSVYKCIWLTFSNCFPSMATTLMTFALLTLLGDSVKLSPLFLFREAPSEASTSGGCLYTFCLFNPYIPFVYTSKLLSMQLLKPSSTQIFIQSSIQLSIQLSIAPSAHPLIHPYIKHSTHLPKKTHIWGRSHIWRRSNFRGRSNFGGGGNGGGFSFNI